MTTSGAQLFFTVRWRPLNSVVRSQLFSLGYDAYRLASRIGINLTFMRPPLLESVLATLRSEHDGYQSIRGHEERAMAFVICRRPCPRNALLRCLSLADPLAADFFDAGLAFGMFSGGGIWDRRVRRLALGLHGTLAAQRPLPARRLPRR